MKALRIIILVGSSICALASYMISHLWTESLAWILVAFFALEGLIEKRC